MATDFEAMEILIITVSEIIPYASILLIWS
jgi:hypothetical protein